MVAIEDCDANDNIAQTISRIAIWSLTKQIVYLSVKKFKTDNKSRIPKHKAS